MSRRIVNGRNSMGAFIFAQAALRQLEKTGKGTLIFTGATASLKGSSGFAAFAPAK
jgi:NAD(P)-dependent dehydrogenase (short-subunit alcohol dehydrogenase family)